MGFLQKTVGKKYEEGNNYKLGQSFRLGGLTSSTTEKSNTEVLTNYYTGVVHTCVTIIAREVAKHQIKVYKRMANGERFEVKQHDIIDLINKPNPEQTQYDIAEATESYREMVGEYFIALNMTESSNKPQEVYVLRPDLFQIGVDSQGNVIGYQYTRPDGKTVRFGKDEIIHDKTFNPTNMYRGVGTIQANIRNISIEDSASEYTDAFFQNNATPAGIVAVKGANDGQVFGDSAHKKLKQKWLDEFQGTEKAGKLAFLREAEVSYQQIGLGLDKVDMKSLRNMTEQAIYKAFGIPMIYAGDFEGMNYASSQTAKQTFVENSIVPRLMKRQQIWQRVADRFWANDNLELVYENVVPENNELKLEVAKSGALIGLTENEKRELVGFDPLEGKEGDVVYRPTTVTPQEEPEKKKLKFKVKAEPDPQAIVKAQIENDRVMKETYRSQQEDLQNKYDKKLKQAINDFLKEQNKLVKDNLSPKKALKDLLFNKQEEDKKLASKIRPLTIALYVDSAELVLEFLGIEDDFNPISTEVDDYIKQQATKVAGDFNEQTRDALVASLSEGYAEGLSTAQIAKRIDDVYKTAGLGKDGYRSERVARTEAIRSNNHATQETYKQLGTINKEWFTNPGACALCTPFEGRVVGVGQNFLMKGEEYTDADGNARTNNYEDVQHPPLHPQCRCVILPVRN